MDLERELTCSICTEILYQPLTLLNCLHTFCGSCSKEWFKWQATAAVKNRKSTNPYTCPSCRESVKGTKAKDWRVTAHLEGFLKAQPDRAKTEVEKAELAKLYQPGEDVIPRVQTLWEERDVPNHNAAMISGGSGGSEADNRRRRAQAARTEHLAHGREEEAVRSQRLPPEELARSQHPSQWASRQQARLTEARLREHDAHEPHIEHQPSLRSLLSASDADPHDVQVEILQSIYNEGLLDGVDLDNLTSAQEEELTERIADAYRRRQRQRDRSRNRDREHTEARQASSGAETQQRPRSQTAESASLHLPQQRFQQESTRSRPPISRPHLFEQTAAGPARRHVRSSSGTSQRSDHSTSQPQAANAAISGSRSATDLSLQPSTDNAQRSGRRSLSSTERSVTDPQNPTRREDIRRIRERSNDRRSEDGANRPSSSWGVVVVRDAARLNENSSSPEQLFSLRKEPAEAQHAVRPAVSMAAFAPEAVTSPVLKSSVPLVTCDRCNRLDIQHDLHYNCGTCSNGNFNICLSCFRAGRGCEHWYGFGYRAFDRFYRTATQTTWAGGRDRPHILTPRRYTSSILPDQTVSPSTLEEGAFCDSCSALANDCYWYCNICMEGAWGFCSACVQQGKHCTHPLLATALLSSLSDSQTHPNPTHTTFIGLPHLRPDTFIAIPVPTSCDICLSSIPPPAPRYHCYECNAGDYDICSPCYTALVPQGKLREAHGPAGWRRCLAGHRMAVLAYQELPDGGGVLRTSVQDRVGGWAFQEDEISLSSRLPAGGLPPVGGVGMKCLALYNYFPAEGVEDELAFPKNAELREVQDRNGDWFWGVYAGRVNLFPSNHVRRLP